MSFANHSHICSDSDNFDPIKNKKLTHQADAARNFKCTQISLLYHFTNTCLPKIVILIHQKSFFHQSCWSTQDIHSYFVQRWENLIEDRRKSSPEKDSCFVSKEEANWSHVSALVQPWEMVEPYHSAFRRHIRRTLPPGSVRNAQDTCAMYPLCGPIVPSGLSPSW